MPRCPEFKSNLGPVFSLSKKVPSACNVARPSRLAVDVRANCKCMTEGKVLRM